MSVQLDALADEVFAAAAAQASSVCVVDRRPFGEVRRSAGYPDLVFLKGITELRAENWSAADLERVIAENFGEIVNVRVCSRDRETIAHLGPRLIEASYQAECRVAMVQVAGPQRFGPVGNVRLVETPADWDNFDRLIRAETAQHGWRVEISEQLTRLYRQGEKDVQSWLLGCVEGQTAGYVGLYQHGRVGYLHALYTRPESRRHGLGSALIHEASELARTRGCERLTLQCARDSFLPNFYQRLGFRGVGEMWIWIKPADP
ncbi:MAG TPA: GNAT family N-acetyltransferase [Candidatus Dormibacteraeota bacterium]